jgi:putative membrane protein
MKMNVDKVVLIGVSILVPGLVATLFIFTSSEANMGAWVYQLPRLNAAINSTTIVILVAALIMIKNGREKAHRNLMLTAFILGAVFMVSYITYHASVPSTVYGDVDHDHVLSASESLAVGNGRIVYLILLLSHILVAVIGLPLVLMAIYHGIKGNRAAHKKVVKFTYPSWMFIAVSGVVVYFLISPYY